MVTTTPAAMLMYGREAQDMDSQDVYKRQVLHHAEGVDLIPANIELAGLEVALVNTMSREKMLKQVLDSAKPVSYTHLSLPCRTVHTGFFLFLENISNPCNSGGLSLIHI